LGAPGAAQTKGNGVNHQERKKKQNSETGKKKKTNPKKKADWNGVQLLEREKKKQRTGFSENAETMGVRKTINQD
jgi:hypothetical protein